jgi:hypothetical protein
MTMSEMMARQRAEACEDHERRFGDALDALEAIYEAGRMSTESRAQYMAEIARLAIERAQS